MGAKEAVKVSPQTLRLLYRIICDINLNSGADNFGTVAQEVATAKLELEKAVEQLEKK